jgi:hypothetical protein
VLRTQVFVGRKRESRRLESAIRNRQSLVISGPAGIGKTALVSNVLAHLPSELAARCLYISGTKDLQDLLRQLIVRLYDLKDHNLRQKLHGEGISALTFKDWLKSQSSSRLKGTLYHTVQRGDYRILLENFPLRNRALAKVAKELFWMRKTPIYLLIRDEEEKHIDQMLSYFYWGDREQLVLRPLPAKAAAALLEDCIERFELSRLELVEFRKNALELSARVPGAIVKMCALAADPQYQHGLCIKTQSVYLDYLLIGHELFTPADVAE